MVPIDDQAGTVQSDRTLLEIINGLQELNGAGITELSQHLGYSKSTVHKHIKTLHQEQYVSKQGGKYKLGFRFLTHGGYVRDRHKLCRLSIKKTREISEVTGEMCVFSVKQGNYGYFAAITNDSFGVRQDAPLGTRYYLHENSGGKAILAQLTDNQINSIIQDVGLPAQTENTVTSRSELFDRIEKVRERGFALNTEERRKGINAVSVSIHDSEIGDYGALTVAGPANRLNEQKLEKHGETLLGAINELELEISYS